MFFTFITAKHLKAWITSYENWSRLVKILNYALNFVTPQKPKERKLFPFTF